MGQYIDSYFLVNNRDSSIVRKFLDEFFPCREEATEDYPVPEYNDNPIAVYKDIEDLYSYLEEHANETYSLYWYNSIEDSLLKNAMAFYTDDKKIIVGVSITGNSPEDMKAIEYYLNISTFLGSDVGCITVEEAPPVNSLEFIEFCNKRYIPDR